MVVMVVARLGIQPLAGRGRGHGGGTQRAQRSPVHGDESRRGPQQALRSRPAVPAVRVRMRVTVLVVAVEAVVLGPAVLFLAHQRTGMFALAVAVGRHRRTLVRGAVTLRRRHFDFHSELVFVRLAAAFLHLRASASAGNGQAHLQRAFVPLVAVVTLVVSRHRG